MQLMSQSTLKKVGVMPLKMRLPEQIDKKHILEILTWHNLERERYETLDNYFKGIHEVLNRSNTLDKKRDDVQEVNNFPKYITTLLNGYFLGKPIKYDFKDGEGNKAIDRLKDILSENYVDDENSELGKLCSIFGHGFEILYHDEEANEKFRYSSPLDTCVILDPYSLEDKIIGAVRRIERMDIFSDQFIQVVEFIDEKGVTIFEEMPLSIKSKSREKNKLELQMTSYKDHSFGGVPVIEYKNNDLRIGDFETVISLIDSYNNAGSDATKNIEDFVQAYLVLTGLGGTKAEDIERSKDMGVLLLPTDGKAEYLVASLDHNMLQFNKERLQDDIHKFSMTPDLTDVNFGGNQSGIAMKFKLFTTEQVAIEKEKKFTKALANRMKMLLNSIAIKNNLLYDYRDIDYFFSRNIPQNDSEVIDNLIKLKGTISDKTILGKLPFKVDVDLEMERIDEEKFTDDYKIPLKTDKING